MKKVKITVMKMACYKDLMEQYENPIEHACEMKLGQVFIAEGWQKPEGFCDSAWDTVSPFVMTLAHGGEDFYDGWMKNKKSAMISCNDGFRPVSFLLEALEEEIQVREIRVEYKKSARYQDIIVPKIAREENRTVVELCDTQDKPYAVVELMGE